MSIMEFLRICIFMTFKASPNDSVTGALIPLNSHTHNEVCKCNDKIIF